MLLRSKLSYLRTLQTLFALLVCFFVCLWILIFNDRAARPDNRIGDQFAQVLDLDLELVMAFDLIQLVEAVMAGCGYDFRAGGCDLVGFGFPGLFSSTGKFGHREHPAAAAATVVFNAVRRHLDKVHDGVAQDITRLINDAAIARLVAGIVEGHPLLVARRVELEAAFLDVLRLEFNKADDLEGIPVPDPVLGLPALGAVAMSALGHHQGFSAQVVDSFFQIGSDLPGSGVIA